MVSPRYAPAMKILSAPALLAAEEVSTSAGFPLWLMPVLAIVLLWVLAIGLAIWVLRRRARSRR